MHPRQHRNRRGHLVGLLQHVVRPVALVLYGLQLTGILHADLERDRRVVHRRSFGPGNCLHTGNARDPEDAFSQLVQDQKICRIPHIVIGFNH